MFHLLLGKAKISTLEYVEILTGMLHQQLRFRNEDLTMSSDSMLETEIENRIEIDKNLEKEVTDR
jgi:beta-lactamase class D